MYSTELYLSFGKLFACKLNNLVTVFFMGHLMRNVLLVGIHAFLLPPVERIFVLTFHP